jgi:hypothetical protein
MNSRTEQFFVIAFSSWRDELMQIAKHRKHARSFWLQAICGCA